MGANPNESPEQTAARLGIGGLSRHVFLCIGPECVTPESGQKAWDALKGGIAQAGLSKSCFRTKVGCLRICNQGPVAVVYPEGVWYRSMDAETIPQLIDQHLAKGQVVENLVIARGPLQADSSSASPS